MSEKNESELTVAEIAAQELKAAQEAEVAFEAGFKDEELRITPEDKGDPNAEQNIEAASDKSNQETEIQKKSSEVDEWEGVPDSIRKRFTDMEAGLAKATQVANAASGQARKLQNQVAEQKAVPPRPTSEQILEAMTDKTKRDALRRDWGDFANAMDEADLRVATAVGAELDKFRSEMSTQFNESQSNYNIKRNLDINHPGWETTINTDSFKDFIYNGGPTAAERTEYENSLSYAQTLKNNSPQESKALYDQANTYYKTLLTKYPTWAVEKGNLYNAPDGASAIKLLDLHKVFTKVDKNEEQLQQQNAEKEVILNKNKQILEANVAPTSGKNTQQVEAENQESEAEKAFADGFNN